MGKKIIYVPDLAVTLGKTEGSIRGHLGRESWPAAIPPPIRIGSRWAWRIEDVELWLEGKATVVSTAKPARPVGRPKKAKQQER
jgi:predicted DNA-binding transcriptional regulator AlpA